MTLVDSYNVFELKEYSMRLGNPKIGPTISSIS